MGAPEITAPSPPTTSLPCPNRTNRAPFVVDDAAPAGLPGWNFQPVYPSGQRRNLWLFQDGRRFRLLHRRPPGRGCRPPPATPRQNDAGHICLLGNTSEQELCSTRRFLERSALGDGDGFRPDSPWAARCRVRVPHRPRLVGVGGRRSSGPPAPLGGIPDAAASYRRVAGCSDRHLRGDVVEQRGRTCCAMCGRILDVSADGVLDPVGRGPAAARSDHHDLAADESARLERVKHR